MIEIEILPIESRYNLDVLSAYFRKNIEDHEQLDTILFPKLKENLYNVDQFSLEAIFYNYFSGRAKIRIPHQSHALLHYLPAMLGTATLATPDPEVAVREFGGLIEDVSKSMPDSTIVLPISRIFRAFHKWPFAMQLPPNVIAVSIETFLPHPNAITAPYPSNYFYPQGGLAQAVDEKLKAKKGDACFFGKPRRNNHMRTQILKTLHGRQNVEIMAEFSGMGRKHLLSDQDVIAMDCLRKRSRFSIELPGDSPSRKGIYDAILSGTIPVLFESGRFNFPFTEVFPWLEACIFIGPAQEAHMIEGRASLADVLAAESEEQYRRRMQLIAKHGEIFQYTPRYLHDEGCVDAFSLTMISAASLAERRRLLSEFTQQKWGIEANGA